MALVSQTKAFTADKRVAVARTTVRGICTRVVAPVQSRRVSAVVCQATAAPEVPKFKGDLLNPTYYPTGADSANVSKKWYIINAEGKTLGRLASLAASVIRGKQEATYTPSMDMGGYVVVINADKVVVSGNKFADKTYFNHVNGRPGSYRMETFKDLQARLPERIIERAVKGMLPKGRLGRDIRLHLKVFKGPSHDHAAQQPVDITAQIDAKPKEGPGAALRASLKKN
uniref:Uncharacterized protein n=1 Tax=Chlamydomonas leiostraca TaxID=1034604 RepID=A0A7S0RLA4_9CHLO|mmetsp:Transcript_250/g.581  ORF Transcript_250/g.581 Transcript_250/m.581 type:complete len:228 (+) Transcript_250:77-760(+)